MGIAGKNREGMRKYRRFVGNPKETHVGKRDLDVRNVVSPSFFGAASEASRSSFGSLGKRGTNGGVTDPSCVVAQ